MQATQLWPITGDLCSKIGKSLGADYIVSWKGVDTSFKTRAKDEIRA